MNTLGQAFRITTFGESHGGGVGVVVDGCPPMLELSESDLQGDLDRRRPGQSRLVTQRQESDQCRILSGTFEGRTLGSPIAILVENQDQRSKDYAEMKEKYRPSHADYTYQAKYGIRNWQGGGRASARETIGRVAGGAIARKILRLELGIEIVAYVKQVRDIVADVDPETATLEAVEASLVRCPDPAASDRMIQAIDDIRKQGDSVGGIVEIVARGVPAGLGEPVFGKLEGELALGYMSLPAARGFEVGSGFGGILLTGSQHNDPFYMSEGHVRTRTNRSGGIQGGISNGEAIVARVAFKPTATILHEQETVTAGGEATSLKGRGRHDPCVLPRAVVICEAVMALTLVDQYLRHRGQTGHFPGGRSTLGT